MKKTEMIPCGCGCGTMILSWKNGVPRFFVKGHQHRKPDAERQSELEAAIEIDCGCGCGARLLNRDSRNRPRKFLPSHGARLQTNTREPVSCENCGKTILRPRWHRDLVKHHFCSLICDGQWSTRNGRRRGENNGHFHSITVPCSGCSAPVTKAVSLIMRRNNRVYCAGCTHLCRQGRKGFYVGYPPEFSATLRRQIRKRDCQICRLCKRSHKTAGTLHVHHIDYDKDNNDPINLIALCKVCHGQTNYGTEQWKARFQAYQAARFG